MIPGTKPWPLPPRARVRRGQITGVPSREQFHQRPAARFHDPKVRAEDATPARLKAGNVAEAVANRIQQLRAGATAPDAGLATRRAK
ncbi:hypothetical protein GIY62_01665 [Burkholderia plantarii]|uniref:hypothetical protein n=1 Tax=Burkholderia plantarii TaxID=41899 RepID=UPI00272D3813|nr:hypothetical protein [Burkholderia plantarii]WLE59433.1 hypothetical protein GIY62_01665 [Burkholderia plantarii]